jgi:ribonuclease D
VSIPADSGDDTTADVPEPAPLLVLRDPQPPVIETPEALTAYCRAVAEGTGPVAIDAERASGYRYSQRAYLIQVRREGAGTALIDPIPFADLTELNDAIGSAEWILHAATQDLPCLAELGLRPERLFDTELVGRLLNLPRVGLATLVEHYFGKSMAKEHSAVDWSTRPLPDSWLEYAALDVEVLVELRELLGAELQETGKLAWAEEEFHALLSFTGPPRREDPWRRTSGIHRVRGRRALGIVREVWETRDDIARRRDTSPGRILPDASILELATSPPKSIAELKDMRIMRNRGPRRFIDEWFDAVTRAVAIPEQQLPTSAVNREGPPPPRVWNEKNPDAAARLGRSREAITKIAADNNLPAENLLSPATVRALAWQPPAPVSVETVTEAVARAGARPWQARLTASALAEALTEQ